MKIFSKSDHLGLSKRSPKRRVYQEEAKTRQTSHWDWDYLPMDTLERLTRRNKSVPTSAPSAPGRSRRIKMALVCIAVGVLLMVALLSYIMVDLKSV